MSQWPQSTEQSGRRKEYFAVDVQVVSHERGQPDDVLVSDEMALGAELLQGSVDVEGVPQHDPVEDQLSALSWSSMPWW